MILPRGNAKTTILSRAALHALAVDGAASVALGSASREMAALAFEMMSGDAEHPALAGQVQVRTHRMQAARGGTLRVVSGRGHRAHGRNDSLFLIDELWGMADDRLLEAAQTGLVKRPDARLWVASTPPLSLDSPLGRLRAQALALPNARRDGPVVTASGDGLRLLEWSLPDDADPDDDEAVAACNPASWITAGLLREQRARCTPEAFLTFHCARSHVRNASWAPPGAWAAARADYTVRHGEPLHFGIDIGGVSAASALVGVTDDLRVGHVTILQGEDSVLGIVAALRGLIDAGQAIASVGYDGWNWRAPALELERDHPQLRLVEVPQNRERMTRVSATLHAALVEGRLRHPGHPELDRHAAAAVAKRHERGWRLSLPTNAPDGVQIDGLIALAIAVAQAETPAPPPAKLLAVL